MRIISRFLIFIGIFFASAIAVSQDLGATEYTYKNISSWHTSVDKLSTEIGSPDDIVASESQAPNNAKLDDFRGLAKSCERHLEDNMVDIDKELEVLGESPDQDTAVVAAARNTLEKEQVRHQRKLTSCKLLLVKIDKLKKILTSQENLRKTQERLYRSYTIIEIVKHIGDLEVFSFLGKSLGALSNGIGKIAILIWFFWFVGLAMVITILFSFYKNRDLFFGESPQDYVTHKLFYYFFTNNHILFFLLAISLYSSCFVYVWSLISETDFPVTRVLFNIVQTLLFLCAANAVFSSDYDSGYFISLSKKCLKNLRRHTRLLIVYYDILFLSISSSIEINTTQVTIDLLSLVLLALFAHSLSKVTWHLMGYSTIKIIRPFKFLVPPASIILAVALLTGYFKFIEFVCLTVAISYFIILGGYFLYRVLTDFLDSLDEGRYQWQKELKETLDISKSEIMPGVIWLRIIIVILVYSGVLIFLLNQWTVSTLTTNKLLEYISSGIEVGKISIVPMQIFQALIFIAISMSALLWTRKQFELRVLSKSRMDVGARDALGSMLMYCLGLLSILVAISIAGVNLGNIAIIAGALSVGIGFGLQAIVNNFVSGLILLLERPIQKGDWIVVDATEGYVKRISVRSTLIQTFDHADVIVPNSDLITHVVKNWTLKNYTGRICIPVGVSYEGDVEKARDILIDIAKKRPESISDSHFGAPKVLLLEFGDSSVNLELRFFIRRVNDSLGIASDVRYEILKRFKEAGIEIPFPQRVMHTPGQKTSNKIIETPGNEI